ncbi:MAG: ribonuclease [Conexibacter sp.]|nr:ribonuclease [Conexibacter sp.]
MRQRRPVRALLVLVRRILERVLALDIVDRSLVIGAQAFSALIPLLIVLASLGSRDGRSFADALIRRFGLSGDAASAVRTAFAAPASGSSITVVGVVLVVVSALSFSRTLQRIFELTWQLPRRGFRGTLAGLRWLAVVVVYGALHLLVASWVHGVPGVLLALAGAFVLWLLTPYILLDGRLPWRRLIPQAGLCAVGMTVLGAGCAVYVPRAMSSSSSEFGAIGVAFTLLSVLWAGGFIIVGAAAIGSMAATGDDRVAGSPPAAPPSAVTAP